MPHMTYCPDSFTGEGAFRFQTLADALDRVGILINLLKLRCFNKNPTHFLYVVLLFPEWIKKGNGQQILKTR